MFSGIYQFLKLKVDKMSVLKYNTESPFCLKKNVKFKTLPRFFCFFLFSLFFLLLDPKLGFPSMFPQHYKPWALATWLLVFSYYGLCAMYLTFTLMFAPCFGTKILSACYGMRLPCTLPMSCQDSVHFASIVLLISFEVQRQQFRFFSKWKKKK